MLETFLETSFVKCSVEWWQHCGMFSRVNLCTFTRLQGGLLTPRGICSMYVCIDGFYGTRLYFRRPRVGCAFGAVVCTIQARKRYIECWKIKEAASLNIKGPLYSCLLITHTTSEGKTVVACWHVTHTTSEGKTAVVCWHVTHTTSEGKTAVACWHELGEDVPILWV